MHKNLATLTGIFILPALFIYCSLAQENVDIKAFEESQRQLWNARTQAKAQKLMDVTAELDSICSRSLQNQNDFSTKKARIDSFYSYDGRIPLLRMAGIDQETSVVIYNISYGGDAFIPIVNVFSTIKGEVRKNATLSFEKVKFSPDTYMHMSVPFQHVCILNDALENKKHIILGGGSRIGNYLALIEMNRNKGELILLETRYFNMWNASVENRVRLGADGIIVRYPMESNVITEGWGEAMLLAEDHISVRNGALKTVARKVLNPWYETVLNAIRLQRSGDREGFNKLCKAERAWQLLSGKINLSAERQEKIGDTKAIVILAMTSSQKKLVFYISKEHAKWIIVKVDQEESSGQWQWQTTPRQDLLNYVSKVRRNIKDELFYTNMLRKAIEQIYRYPLRQAVVDTINRQLKSGVTNKALSELVVALYEEGKLFTVHVEGRSREPRIICSMGLVAGQ